MCIMNVTTCYLQTLPSLAQKQYHTGGELFLLQIAFASQHSVMHLVIDFFINQQQMLFHVEKLTQGSMVHTQLEVHK